MTLHTPIFIPIRDLAYGHGLHFPINRTAIRTLHRFSGLKIEPKTENDVIRQEGLGVDIDSFERVFCKTVLTNVKKQCTI